MKIYIFRCRARPRMYGATRYETGSNLPTGQCAGGWEFLERVDLGSRGTVRFVVDARTLVRQVQRTGWYVWEESLRELRRRATSESEPMSGKQQRLNAPETAVSKVNPAHTGTDWTPAGTAISPLLPDTVVSPVPAEIAVAPARPVAMGMVPKLDPTPSSELTARHQVVWFDIPVRDLDRAVGFYSAVLGTQLRKEQVGPGVAMAILPYAEGTIGGCLLQSADSKPSESGPLVYLNTDGRLDEALNAVERHGGRVLAARHSIAPFGFRAIVLDSEGNRIALHSK